MHFALTCVDKPDHGPVRADNRPAHLDYLKANAKRVFAAGPILSDDGEHPVGSLLIMEFDDLSQARAFADGDPYANVRERHDQAVAQGAAVGGGSVLH